MKCRDCGKDQTYTLSSKRKENQRRIYVDESGRQWNGLQCPSCKYGGFSKGAKSKRLCKCGRFMEKTRYFKCMECKPVLESDPGFTMPW